MTQHNEAVERQRDILAAEKWGEGVKYILGQDGYVETLYNSGKRQRVYRNGKTEVLDEPMNIEQLIISMSQAQADANIR